MVVDGLARLQALNSRFSGLKFQRILLPTGKTRDFTGQISGAENREEL